MGACRVTWLLERVNELACGEVMCLSRATLDSAGSTAQVQYAEHMYQHSDLSHDSSW